MKKILDEKFFNRPALIVAEDLIGKYLIRKIGKKEYVCKITETEAYIGPHDKASHAYKGKNKKNEAMYMEPGMLYVYLIYGMYYMLNVVTDKKDYPSAVLIRGVDMISGPGRLTRALKITKKSNKKPAIPKYGLWFEDRNEKIPSNKIKKTPRIGVDYSKEWRNKPFRFVLEK